MTKKIFSTDGKCFIDVDDKSYANMLYLCEFLETTGFLSFDANACIKTNLGIFQLELNHG